MVFLPVHLQQYEHLFFTIVHLQFQQMHIIIVHFHTIILKNVFYHLKLMIPTFFFFFVPMYTYI